MKKNKLAIIALCLLLVGCLSACTQSQFPIGTFSYVPKGGYQMDHVLEFHDDGTWIAYVNQEIGSYGTYSIQGNEFVFVTDDYCDADQTGPATYVWTYEDDILTFTAKGSDSCGGRHLLMNNRPYGKQP